MLPALSHATSVGLAEAPSRGCLRRAGDWPPAAATAAATDRRRRTAAGPPAAARGRTAIASGLRPSTSATRPSVSNFTTWLAPTSMVQTLSCGSTRRPIRGVEAVDVLAQLAHELAGGDRTGTAASRRGRTCGCRRAWRRDGRCACRRRSGPSSWRRRRRPRRRRRRAACAADRRWCRTRSPARRPGRRPATPPATSAAARAVEQTCADHRAPPLRWSSRCGFSRIFCERQSLISAV